MTLRSLHKVRPGKSPDTNPTPISDAVRFVCGEGTTHESFHLRELQEIVARMLEVRYMVPHRMTPSEELSYILNENFEVRDEL